MRNTLLGAAIGCAVLVGAAQPATALDPRDRSPDSIAKPSDDIERGPEFDPPLHLFDGRLQGDVNIDFGVTDDPRNTSGDAENDFFLSADLSALFKLAESVSVIGDFSIFSLGDKQTRALFDQPAIALNELYVFVDVLAERLALFAGKLEPEFESSFGQADGVFDLGYRNDLELSSSIGFGAEYYFGVFGRTHKLSAVAYMQDRTILSETLINETERLTKREGGLANTHAPESFIVRLAGEVEWFDYVFALRRQIDVLEEDPDEDERRHNETTALVGFGFTLIDSEEDGELRIVGETAKIYNFDGEDVDALYWAFGATYELDRVLLGFSHVQRDVDEFEVDNFTVASVEYDLGEGFFAGGEVSRYREEGEIRGAWGLQLSYRRGF